MYRLFSSLCENRKLVIIGLMILSLICIWYYTAEMRLYQIQETPLSSMSVSVNYTHNSTDTDILKTISCYSDSVSQTFDEETLNRTIFFIESSCKGELNSKQACSVESAARANPEWKVIVLFAGPFTTFQQNPTFKTLTSLGNVQIVRINVETYSKGTPLETLFTSDILTKSEHPVVHSSDVLRILTLFKHSGVYLDLDVLVIKSFDTLPNNFVGKESENSVANGILGLSDDEIGRNFSRIAALDLASSYSPTTWAGNGPALVARTLKQICNTTDVADMSSDTCNGFAVLPPKTFFPIPYPSWRKYYADSEPSLWEEYTHHMWNALSYQQKVSPKSMYARLAMKFCPDLYALYGVEFGS